MGNKAGKAFSNIFPSVARSVKNYNIEDRAAKAISKDKRPVAPRHKSTVDILDKFSKEHPELYDAQKMKDENLHERLRQVHVESHGTTTDIKSKRHLPEITKNIDDPEMGFTEPEHIPPGKVSLRKAIEIITKHQDFQDKYTTEELAKEYKLELVQVQNVIKYFQTFQLHLSQELFKKHPTIEKIAKAKQNETLVYRISDTTNISSKQTKSSSSEDIPSGRNSFSSSISTGKK